MLWAVSGSWQINAVGYGMVKFLVFTKLSLFSFLHGVSSYPDLPPGVSQGAGLLSYMYLSGIPVVVIRMVRKHFLWAYHGLVYRMDHFA